MKRDNEFYGLMKRIMDSINDPFSIISADDEFKFEMLKLEAKHDSIVDWYDITQRLVNLLYDLKAEGKLKNDSGKLRRLKSAVNDFGWNDETIKSGEFYPDNLSSDSPYRVLSELNEIENGITNKNEKLAKRSQKQLEKEIEKRCDEFDDEEIRRDYLNLTSEEFVHLARVMYELRNIDNDMRTYLDESIDVYDLYSESEHNEAQALKDIRDIKTLSVRLANLVSDLDNDPALKCRKKTIEAEIIYKAIAIGYTAGINANVTETLRRSKGNNSSEN